jgi:hypothetical protein
VRQESNIARSFGQLFKDDLNLTEKFFEIRIPSELSSQPHEDIVDVWLKFAQHQPRTTPEQKFRICRLDVGGSAIQIYQIIQKLKKLRPNRKPDYGKPNIAIVVRDLAFEFYSLHQRIELLQRSAVNILKTDRAKSAYRDFATVARRDLCKVAKELLTYRGKLVHGNDSPDPFKVILVLGTGIVAGISELTPEYLSQQMVLLNHWTAIASNLEKQIVKFLDELIIVDRVMLDQKQWSFVP